MKANCIIIKIKLKFMDFAIEIENLIKIFKIEHSSEIRAVDGLNLRVNRGEMFGLVGPDGAGKTTTIRMLCGIVQKTSGKIKILGYDIDKDSDKIKANIGYLSQRFSLYGDLTIDENIEFFAEMHHVSDFKKRREELLEFTRLTPFRDRLAEKLSGGMKQKLALACTLIHTPKVIFLDEPTTGVDPVSRRDFWRILSSLLKSGITIFMSTPYLDEAERCTRVGLINKGKIMIADNPANIKSFMKGEIIEIVCSEIRKAFIILKTVSSIKEVQAFGDRLNVVVEKSDNDFPPIKTKLLDSGINVESWRVIPPSLENVFISLMKQ
jgi:ABC-2 type transport system ATP-binding protein